MGFANKCIAPIVLILMCSTASCGANYAFRNSNNLGVHRTRWENDTLEFRTSDYVVVVSALEKKDIAFGIELTVRNVGSSKLELHVSKCQIKDGSGLVNNAMEADDAAAYAAARIQGTMYVAGGLMGQAAGNSAVAEMRSQMLDSGPIESGTARKGFVYFRQVPDPAYVAVGPAISVDGIPVSIPWLELSTQ